MYKSNKINYDDLFVEYSKKACIFAWKGISITSKFLFSLVSNKKPINYLNDIVLGYGINNNKQFTIKLTDLFTHILTTGKSGSGKSGLMNILAIELLNRNQQIMLLDPDGQELEKIIKRIKNTNKVDIYSLSSEEYILGFNPLVCFEAEIKRRELINDLKSILNGVEEKGRSAYDSSSGYNVDEGLDIVLSLAVEFNYNYFNFLLKKFGQNKAVEIFRNKQINFVDLSRLLDSDLLKTIRNFVNKFLKDKIDNLETQKEKQKLEFAIGRIKKLVANPKLALMLQSRGLNIWDSLNNDQSVLFDLSDLKDADKYFLGKFIFSKVLAFQKNRIKTQDKSLIMLIDEARYIEMPAIAEIIANARKFKMGLILFLQFLGQFKIKEVQESAHNTIVTKVYFMNEDKNNQDTKFLEKRQFINYEYDKINKAVLPVTYKTVEWPKEINKYNINYNKGLKVQDILNLSKIKQANYEKFFLVDKNISLL